MTSTQSLRLLSYASLGFALVLAILTLTLQLSPTAPAYLTFLFTGLVGNFAAGALRNLERRVSELERRNRP